MGLSDLVFKAKEGGKWIYNNIKTGVDEAKSERVNGAKGNPPLSKREARRARNAQRLKDAAASAKREVEAGPAKYDDFRRPAKYTVTKDITKRRKGKKPRNKTFQELGESPRSVVNKWSLMRYRGIPIYNYGMKRGISKENYANTKGTVLKLHGRVVNPSAKFIVQACSTAAFSPGYQYSLKDFVYTKYYGKIPNNQMLTLRRFAFPVEDNIINPIAFSAKGKPFPTHQPALAQALTWMGEKPGNELKSILKFSVGYNWKEAESKLQEINSQPRDRGKLGSFIDSSPIAQRIEGGLRGESASTTYRRNKHGSGWDPMKQTYPNHSLVPLNIIKSVQVREAGLKFSQEFSLKFHYDLKGIPGTSPKIAFLDVLANLLVLTYNQAPFWGGAVRYTGGGKVGKPFGDLAKLQSGDVKGFMGSIVKDLAKTATNLVQDIMKGGDSKILNNVIGGAMMDLLGGPQGGQVAAAFLSGDPTGSWHLTIGNPLNPIAVVGNLACTDAEFEFDGPLGYEDFPTKLAVTIKLKPARPRDKTDIESMFNSGRGRLYIPEEGALDPSITYDVDAYGKVYGDKNGQLARHAHNFSNG